MAEGGNAEKFPDEWDLQFLGNTIISQLSSGIPPDFLIKRYVLFTLYHYNDSILLLKFPISLIQKVFANFFFQNFSFLPVQESSSRDRTWVQFRTFQHLWLPPFLWFLPWGLGPSLPFYQKKRTYSALCVRLTFPIEFSR